MMGFNTKTFLLGLFIGTTVSSVSYVYFYKKLEKEHSDRVNTLLKDIDLLTVKRRDSEVVKYEDIQEVFKEDHPPLEQTRFEFSESDSKDDASVEEGSLELKEFLELCSDDNRVYHTYELHEGGEVHETEAIYPPIHIMEDESNINNVRIEVITENIMNTTEPNYDKVLFTYFEIDDVLVDEQGGVIYPAEDAVGDEALLGFDEDTDFVYVRNHRYKFDAEVVKTDQEWYGQYKRLDKERGF